MNDELVWEIEDVFSENFCNEIINKFESDPKKHDGVTLGGFQSSIKQTTELHISSFLDWKSYDEIIQKKIFECIDKYYNKISEKYRVGLPEIYDEGYLIQKIIPKSIGYVWHHDFLIKPNGDYRFLTLIIYLNTVNEKGETEFLYGKKIIPKCGKVLIFPSTWTYNHRGNPPVNSNKYIITTFIYHKYNFFV